MLPHRTGWPLGLSMACAGGWKLEDRQIRHLECRPWGRPDARGWLWSEELASWLAPDGMLLHLYDAQGRLCLTEAAARADEARVAAAQAERERRARQDAESALAVAEAARADEVRRRVALEEELRRLRQGRDPQA